MEGEANKVAQDKKRKQDKKAENSIGTCTEYV